MAEHNNLTSLFSDIADAIRKKNGSTGTIVADNFPSVIAAINTQEDLDPELADQDAKIAELQELLQGKAVPAPEDLTEELAAQSEIIAQLAGALEVKSLPNEESSDYRQVQLTIESEGVFTGSFIYYQNGTLCAEDVAGIYMQSTYEYTIDANSPFIIVSNYPMDWSYINVTEISGNVVYKIFTENETIYID